jgi:sulfatase maturation enzyme AslB (radical SAM superfamily)
VTQPREAIMAAQLRRMQISDLTDWLRSRTNKHHWPFLADTIVAYCVVARALCEWMSGHDVNGDLIPCDTVLLNRFFANYLACHSQSR